MDSYINKLIEKNVSKPITEYQRELIKIGMLGVIGLVIGIFMLIDYGFSSFDFTWFIVVLYPVGFYYGWRTVFDLLKGKGSGATQAGLITTFFSGNGFLGIIIGVFSLIISIVIALFFGWIVGFINMFKVLKYYKAESLSKVNISN